jgi:hypothetical protein
MLNTIRIPIHIPIHHHCRYSDMLNTKGELLMTKGGAEDVQRAVAVFRKAAGSPTGTKVCVYTGYASR